MEKSKDIYTKLTASSEEALVAITAPNNEGTFASNDYLFRGAIFGRDSLEVAEDVIHTHPEITKSTILTLASLQGFKYDLVNEEEPGKIHHEFRREKGLSEPQETIFKALTDNWGKEYSSKNECWQMNYFGSVDSTPLFLRTVAKYRETIDPDILNERIVRRDGTEVSLYESVVAASSWLIDRLNQDVLGLLTYKRQNPKGIANQAWKDSDEFYTHLNGEKVNHQEPIASIEVQGLAYDALLAAADMVPEMSEDLRQKADIVQQNTLNILWQEDKKYFALGLDYVDGEPRIIQTKTANPASLLDTRIFDNLPEQQKQIYVSGIVDTIFSNDFMTKAGVRSRALSQSDLIKYWDYHGSFVVWSKESYDIIKGLHRQGLHKLGAQIENRVLNTSRADSSFREFHFVDSLGRVLYGPQSDENTADLIRVPSTNNPESIQAWTVAAVIGILHRKHQALDTLDHTWKFLLERETLNSTPNVEDWDQTEEIEQEYPAHAYLISSQAAFA